MKKSQKNKLKMYKVVLSVCTNAAQVCSRVPAFQKAVNDFQVLVTEIERLQALQSADNKGITVDNQVLNNQLSESALTICGALFAWASENGTHKLKEKVNYQKSDFIRFSQTERIAVCTGILEDAKMYADKLVNNGITQENISELETLLNSYRNAYTKPREMVVSRTAITEALLNAFKKANALLKEQTDRLVLQFKNSDPEFYQQYRQARVTEERGIRHNAEVPGTETTGEVGDGE
ncbi:MAG: hypothetical protein A2W90_16525 [Bacteroidetes bacterium GWF2_42_66]|nr:MAG: hypothetical protein A2W92_04090 [Bacteroidetes bacterium GWA2_42_15]OFX96299.1 MAG: hypothetical protein A2W89_05455 [Bacteroidetes bacterium GWE2_42_39]OFY46338.1 MAG: hypothetical protein A2W90_16525 [Bacteroidetes bacterium GWF2_42_66]HAZ03459.1 hypothetical protein [Marinilabiliales bacterium]HBL78276.1 hypothetical protein [Prolixibacteraceae bacterium]